MRNKLFHVVEEILHFNLVYMMLVIGSGITELRLSTLNVTSNICQPHRIKKSLLKSNYTCSVFDLERNKWFHVVEEILLFDLVYRMLVIGAGITQLRGSKNQCRNSGLSEWRPVRMTACRNGGLVGMENIFYMKNTSAIPTHWSLWVGMAACRNGSV